MTKRWNTQNGLGEGKKSMKGDMWGEQGLRERTSESKKINDRL